MSWLPYSQREEWRDLAPIPQNDGPNPVVAIQYSPQFRETMDYFRAVLGKNEMSQRALDLTEDVIDLNAGNYTVWAYRRAVIDAISRDWNVELEWVSALADNNPKNYQIWQHRRYSLEKCNGGSSRGQQEIDFLNEFLTSEELNDAKNYHAWAHRQWVVRTFALWEGEHLLIEQLLEQDIRNNSAWNQRYFVVSNTTDMSLTVRQSEVHWALEKAALAPNNESAWSYIRGMMESHQKADFPELVEKIDAYCQREPPPAQCLELKADLFLERKDKASIDEALIIFQRLGTDIDVIRSRYWTWRKEEASKSV